MKSTSKPKPLRGRESVKAALIKAAGELLAEIGPNAMSVRDVAELAGVNHGQVHHYFNGKAGLLKAAMHQLALDHYKNSRARSGSQSIPKGFTLGLDATYVKAVVRLVIDDELELATREIHDGISVPRDVTSYIIESTDPAQVVDGKAAMAAMMSMELAWALLEPYILMQVDASTEEAEPIRERLRQVRRSIPQLLGVKVPQYADTAPTDPDTPAS